MIHGPKKDEIHWKTRRSLLKALAEATSKYEDERADCGVFQRKVIALEQALAERTRELENSQNTVAEMTRAWDAAEVESTEDRAAIRAMAARAIEKDNGYFRCLLCGPRQFGAYKIVEIIHRVGCPIKGYAAAIQRASEGEND